MESDQVLVDRHAALGIARWPRPVPHQPTSRRRTARAPSARPPTVPGTMPALMPRFKSSGVISARFDAPSAAGPAMLSDSTLPVFLSKTRHEPVAGEARASGARRGSASPPTATAASKALPPFIRISHAGHGGERVRGGDERAAARHGGPVRAQARARVVVGYELAALLRPGWRTARSQRHQQDSEELEAGRWGGHGRSIAARAL